MLRWHTYLERVYHQPLHNAYLDLNLFTFFYADAPTAVFESR